MNVSQWKSGLAHRAGLPADLQDSVQRYPEVASICCERNCYGVLLLVSALKMPTARNVFLRCWKNQGCGSSVEFFWRHCRNLLPRWVEGLRNRNQRNWRATICTRLASAATSTTCDWKLRKRQGVVLGNTETTARLQKIGAEATRSIRSWLDLHVAVFAVIKLSPPSTVAEWTLRACILYEAFKFYKVPGCSSANNHFLCQWWWKHFWWVYEIRKRGTPANCPAWQNWRSEWTWSRGSCPENCRTMQGVLHPWFNEGHFGTMAFRNCSLLCICGLVPLLVASQEEMFWFGWRLFPSRRTDFQTRTSFLRDTCGVTSIRQPAYEKIQMQHGMRKTPLPRISKFKVSSLNSDIREGTVDVVTQGMAVLWGSLDEPGKLWFGWRCTLRLRCQRTSKGVARSRLIVFLILRIFWSLFNFFDPDPSKKFIHLDFQRFSVSLLTLLNLLTGRSVPGDAEQSSQSLSKKRILISLWSFFCNRLPTNRGRVVASHQAFTKPGLAGGWRRGEFQSAYNLSICSMSNVFWIWLVLAHAPRVPLWLING